MNVRLTRREAEILALCVRGLAARAIATELYITESTVRWYLARLFQKFCCGSSEELAYHYAAQLSAEQRANLLATEQGKQFTKGLAQLTDVERQTLDCLVAHPWMTEVEIAAALWCSPGGMKGRFLRIREKCGVSGRSSRQMLVLWGTIAKDTDKSQ